MIAQLDTKTVYSFMESVVSIEKYVQTAKEYGYSHLAIMDVDNLYGAYHSTFNWFRNDLGQR